MAFPEEALAGLSKKELTLLAIVGLGAALLLGVYLPIKLAIGSGYLLFVACLIAIVDARQFTIPNISTYATFVLGFVIGEPEGMWGSSLLASLAGATIGGGALLALRYGYRRLRGFDGLGLGDVKLVAAGGAWLGLGDLPFWLLAASILALAGIGFQKAIDTNLILSRHSAVPFGCFLAPSLWLVWTCRKLFFP